MQNTRILCMSFVKYILKMAKLLELSHWENTFPLKLWIYTFKLLVLSKSGYVSPTPTRHIKYSSSEPNFTKCNTRQLRLCFFYFIYFLRLHVLLFFFQSLPWYLHSTSPALKFRLPQTTVEKYYFSKYFVCNFRIHYLMNYHK